MHFSPRTFNNFRSQVSGLSNAVAQNVVIKLVRGQEVFEAEVPCFYTFGQLKEHAATLTGIPVDYIRLNFKGRNRAEQETLAGAGVKNGVRIVIGLSDAGMAAEREKRAHQFPAQAYASAQATTSDGLYQAEQAEAHDTRPQQHSSPHTARHQGSSRQHTPARPIQKQTGRAQSHVSVPEGWATFADSDGIKAPPPTPVEAPIGPPAPTQDQIAQQAIDKIALEVDALEAKVRGLDANGAKSKEAVGLAEMLTQKLLLLDSIDVTPACRLQRKAQVNRINALCDHLEAMKSS